MLLLAVLCISVVLAAITVQLACFCSDGCSKEHRAAERERKHQTKVEFSLAEVCC